MIIVQLIGGLGNQMFQYAAGRRLSHVKKVPLKLDLSWFESIAAEDTARKYELHPLNIKEVFSSREEVDRIKKKPANKIHAVLRKPLNGLLQHRQTYYREKHFHFDPAVLKLRDDVYLEGYWQSEKYFIDIEDIIRRELMIRTEPDGLNRKTADEIQACNSVSIHIRRGDYVLNPVTNQYHGTCPPDYYHEAINIVAKKIKTPHFFAFSDEPSWAKQNLKSDFRMTYIDFNGPGKAYEDMRLLSLCKHHIIANSSFSWWGAWLSQYTDKIVISPATWFNDSSIDTNDLVPDGWLRI